MTDDIETGLDAFGNPMAPHALSPPPEVPQPAQAPSGLQKLPRVWAYLTKDARPPEPTVDAFGNPIEPTAVASPAAVKPAPGKTQDGERSAFSGDWGDGDGPTSSGEADAFDVADVFNTMPPDIHLSHEGKQIVASLAEDMSGLGMTVSQIHEALRFASELAGSEVDDTATFERFALHMSQFGVTRSQADKVKVWADSYEGSEEQKDDAAEAAVDEAIERIHSKMGTAEYIKSEKMQEAYRILLDVRDGDGDK